MIHQRVFAGEVQARTRTPTQQHRCGEPLAQLRVKSFGY